MTFWTEVAAGTNDNVFGSSDSDGPIRASILSGSLGLAYRQYLFGPLLMRVEYSFGWDEIFKYKEDRTQTHNIDLRFDRDYGKWYLAGGLHYQIQNLGGLPFLSKAGPQLNLRSGPSRTYFGIVSKWLGM